MSKRRPFFIGTNGPILNVQKTFILGRVPTGQIQYSNIFSEGDKEIF